MDDNFLEGKKDTELEKIGEELFKRIGLNCICGLGQIKLNDITSGYPEGEHIEFDYLIPESKLCLIGEITGRGNIRDIQKKFNKFIDQINKIKDRIGDSEIWGKLGIQSQDIRLFREVTSIKGFFITTTKEKCDISLKNVDEIAIFYKSDLVRLHEYSENIGKWTKNYFLNHFCPEYVPNNGITIYEESLIRSPDVKISEMDTLADLYTFTKSPYDLLDITHVYRRDELPSLTSSTYNYQRPLNYEKLKEIRKKLLTNQDFIFPSNILVILSKECKYSLDGIGKKYLYIPNKYGNVSVIDGQHRLFSYANDNVQKIMKDDCKIMITTVQFKTYDEELIGQLSAKVFVEINANQTKVEIEHLDKITYDLGSDDPKVIATRIIVELNSRNKFHQFFDISSGQTSQGIIESGMIIQTIKKITNITNIKKLENPRTDKTKAKKNGYEQLFNTTITELSTREELVKQGVILLERYFNEVFSVFRNDKPKSKTDPKTSFLLAKFWSGWINLLIIFLEEGLDWNSLRNELNKIKDHVMELCKVESYNTSLFKPDDRIPNSSHSPTKVCKFLNKNRKEPTSIQDIK